MSNGRRHHHKEAGITDDCSDCDRFSLPEIDLLNLCEPAGIDGGVRHTTNQNSGRRNTKKQSEKFQPGKGNLGEGTSKIPKKKNTKEQVHCHTVEVKKAPKSQHRSSRRSKSPHTIRDCCEHCTRKTEESRHLEETVHRTDRRKRSVPPKSPTLANRRMDLLFRGRENSETAGVNKEKTKEFPFKETPSGHLKINRNQVVFTSKKVSILVADPKQTKLDIDKKYFEDHHSPRNAMPPIPGKFFQPPTFKGDCKELFAKMSSPDAGSEYDDSDGDGPENLRPEMKLERLGYSNNTFVDHEKLDLPEKSGLFMQMQQRIHGYMNTDKTVIIGLEEFSCHSMVLQIYSDYFEEHRESPKIELPIDKVTVNAFVIIYDWMITDSDCAMGLLRKDNILELFIAAQFLRIKELEEQCWAFLDSEEVFSEDSAFLLYVEAKKLNIPAVKEIMIPRIRKFFLMLVSSQDFLELDIDELCIILSSNYILLNGEIEVMLSAVRWLKTDWDNRIQHLVRLMSCVRFGNIAPWQLVDIRRNPQNPDIVKIMNIPEIQKMVDDGLSYVIVKYWYHNSQPEFNHWISLLGLVEPQERNWTGTERNYRTYRQFIAFLDEYRRENLLELSRNQRKLPRDYNLQPCMSPGPGNHGEEACVKKRIPKPSEPTPRIEQGCGDSSPSSVTHSCSEYEIEPQKQEVVCASVQTSPRLTETIKNEKGHSQTVKQEVNSQNLKVLAMFNQNQNSVLANPATPKYLVKGSLFFRDYESVLVFGGIDPHSPIGCNRNTATDIYRYLTEQNTWEYVGDMPEPRQYHSTVFYRGKVFLAGGANPVEAKKGKSNAPAVNTVWSFNPITKEWFAEHPMITSRKSFELVVSNMKLYAIGGTDKNDRILSSVERFEYGGTWQEVASLKKARSGMACAKYRDCIWVVGGISGSSLQISSSVECYDTRKNEWTLIEKIRFPRCYARLIAVDDRLFLIGGATRVTQKNRNAFSVTAIDVWDPRDREWKLEAELAIARHGHVVGYIGKQILSIGGLTTMNHRALSNTECYCCGRTTWIRGLSPLPMFLTGHSAVTLPPASYM